MNSALGMGQMLTESAVGITVGVGFGRRSFCCKLNPWVDFGGLPSPPQSVQWRGFINGLGIVSERYQAILDRLPGFTQDNLPNQIDEALKEIRRLWLFAPNDVVRAANAFVQAVETGESKRNTLGKLVIAMRRDASFQAALFPGFYRNTLNENEVSEIKTATRKRP